MKNTANNSENGVLPSVKSPGTCTVSGKEKKNVWDQGKGRDEKRGEEKINIPRAALPLDNNYQCRSSSIWIKTLSAKKRSLLLSSRAIIGATFPPSHHETRAPRPCSSTTVLLSCDATTNKGQGGRVPIQRAGEEA